MDEVSIHSLPFDAHVQRIQRNRASSQPSFIATDYATVFYAGDRTVFDAIVMRVQKAEVNPGPDGNDPNEIVLLPGLT